MEQQHAVDTLNDAKLAWHLGAKDENLFIETACSSKEVVQALRTLQVPADIVVSAFDIGADGVYTLTSFKVMVQGEENLVKLRDKGVIFPGSDKVGKTESNLSDDMHKLIEAAGGQNGWVKRLVNNNPAVEAPVRAAKLI